MATENFILNVLDLEIDVVRKDIKHLHLSVYPPDGRVRIASPKDVKEDAIRLFAINKLKWIRSKQQKQINQIRQGPREFIAGESHWVLGKRYLLKIENIRSGKHQLRIENKKYLILSVRSLTTAKNRAKIFDSFYRQQLMNVIPKLIEKWSTKLGVECKEFLLLKMTTKWGSCVIEKNKIILNTDLGKKTLPQIEYVVLHELTHLLIRKHNRAFIDVLDKHMPDWKIRRKELNDRI